MQRRMEDRAKQREEDKRWWEEPDTEDRGLQAGTPPGDSCILDHPPELTTLCLPAVFVRAARLGQEEATLPWSRHNHLRAWAAQAAGIVEGGEWGS